MPIRIKYSFAGEFIGYASFQEIKQLEHYNEIVYIDCSCNKLTSLPEHLPNSLQKLDCALNKLTSLPEHLPNSLQELNFYGNKLTSLPEHLPYSLKQLFCRSNKLTSLPEDLPNSLQKLYCGLNKLTSLPKHLPSSLKQLFCYSNKLTSLPNSIIHCRNLQYISFEDNEIDCIPPHMTQFLNRLRNNTNDITVYCDRQNAHKHQNQQSIRDSIYSIMSNKPIVTMDETVAEVIKSPILTEQTKCLIGRMSRLINCLNSFDDRETISIADNS